MNKRTRDTHAVVFSDRYGIYGTHWFYVTLKGKNKIRRLVLRTNSNDPNKKRRGRF
tara:strand:+ start:2015 stop:2182 length:168 start_codon:yes stop_codon:yes gene_type:complete